MTESVKFVAAIEFNEPRVLLEPTSCHLFRQWPLNWDRRTRTHDLTKDPIVKLRSQLFWKDVPLRRLGHGNSFYEVRRRVWQMVL